ncbi:tight junction protein ZO-1-like isoform X5 [Photinus pyralis]|nr:tight junction protein ZO-1-like isoform X5 [Photinus pyralis]
MKTGKRYNFVEQSGKINNLGRKRARRKNVNSRNILLRRERGWEYKQVTVTRVQGYGFGIAVSGGRDNPHFASGDPSIAVSDVLASGPAERLLHVNDRIITVNGISLQNVDYATAVQVLRDSGDTVVLLIKRRVTNHQHSHSLGSGPPLAALGINPLPAKVTLTKNSKKEDFGVVIGCKLFIKELSTKAREQLLSTNQSLNEGDFITKLNNTNCNDLMSLKEAKKIIDSSKDKLHITVARDFNQTSTISHQTQSSVSTTGAVNNFYKDDFLTSPQSYSNQNLYVQPPTRNPNVNANGGFDDKLEQNGGPSSLDDKSNLAPRGRLRQPLSEANINQLNRNSLEGYGRAKNREEPPRPPPPRPEDYYSSRRQLYDDDPIIHKTKQPVPDARYITFHKEGSVGIRLTGGNFVGIFVTAVQPGSPASLQGLQPGDKILKVNDMDMTGVTREEAVLFLLSLQDRIELIVQFCKEEYDGIVASQKGDSFYIKTHFHYENSVKGEMSFKSGDIFHVIDTLYNGVVGCWQVYRIGRNNQQGQKGIIPNKSRAEELATAQFNATKKEMSANESRGSFFRRRRNSNRRSKSLGKEHWDDILFSDTVSKFPAYERVVLKHPGFTRPVILFGPIADVARDKLLKDFPDKFISPQLDSNLDDSKPQKMSSNIIRLSAIREVISTGKHALLDITPNTVERLNYAQLYPVVVFFKAESKIIIKQMRQGLPKSAHKSSKKLLEQCQKLDKVWNHIFCSTITLNDNTDNWYRKVREIIDKQQSGAVWMSETKPEESLSDDFLFPMSSLRLSYASSPESDLEHSPGPPVSTGLSGGGNGNAGRLTKASSDPSVVMPDSSTTDVLPPYQPTYDTRYGFGNQSNSESQLPPSTPPNPTNQGPNLTPEVPGNLDPQNPYKQSGLYSHSNDYSKEPRNDYIKEGHKRQSSTLHGMFNHSKGNSLNEQNPRSPKDERMYATAPDLPPRVDRAVKPIGLLVTPTKTNGRSAHERLFGTKPLQQSDSNEQNNNAESFNNKLGSLERSVNSKSDSLSSYDSYKQQLPGNSGIGPNAHDDLKTTLSKIDSDNPTTPSKYPARWDQNNHRHDRLGSKLDLKYAMGVNNVNDHPDQSPRNSHEVDKESSPLDHLNPRMLSERDRQEMYRSPAKQNSFTKTYVETKTDYGKYSRNNNSQDYTRTSHQDLTQAQLTVHNVPPHHHNQVKNNYHHSNGFEHQNGPPNAYKPVPPPKPKNYKPPYKNQGYGPNDGILQPSVPYQHAKSYSNSMQDQRSPTMNSKHDYYYNMPPANNWHTETAVRYNSSVHGPYDMAPPYDSHRHTNISYASRSEITPISQRDNSYSMESADVVEARLPERHNIVDLQGSREQRGSAFELYRKPMHHNMRDERQYAFYGSQPNIAHIYTNNASATNNTPNKITPKLTKTQSFNHRKRDGLSTPQLFRKFLFKHRNKDGSAKSGKKVENRKEIDDAHIYGNIQNSRDVTCAVVDTNGATLINHYWGVSLDIPKNAIPEGRRQEVYFVITDPRLCNTAPPLDLENGETMLSPLVMCGPQGTEFLKPVILSIPHYANTLPSLGISLKATDSEKDIHTDWDNILLPSNHATNRVSVKVDHF